MRLANALRRSPAFAVPAVVYLAVASLLVLVAHNIVGDAWSRVGNAYYVLYSRDPHLAAIGFVWNPLPSLLVMPLLPLRPIFPALVQLGFAANIVSAIAMAFAVAQVHAMLGDLGVRQVQRVALTILFAAHPMIVLYAANGMSEALFLLFLVMSARQLVLWLRSRETRVLVRLAIVLALAYLTRYEAVASAAAATAVVGVASFLAAAPARRRAAAFADIVIVALPFAATFVVWAATSWIIVGSPFETFTSVYGNSSQVGLAREGIRAATGQGTLAAVGYALSQIIGLEPLALGVVLVLTVIAIRGRDARAVAPAAVFGAVIAFALVAFLAGSSFGWLRFYIAIVPCVILLAGCLDSALNGASRIQAPQLLRRAPLAFAIAGAALALPVAAATMFDPALGREEAYQLHDLAPDAALDGAMPQANRPFVIGGAVARYLDSLSLGRGTVLVDVATGFPIVLQSSDPKQFVITTDRDFNAVLTDPAVFGVGYLIVQTGAGSGQLDAVGRAYDPIVRGLGSGAAFVRHFGEADDTFGWDIYAVAGLDTVAPAEVPTGR